MEVRHHRRTIDTGFRLSGAALCGASWMAIRTLAHMRLAPLPASPGLMAAALAIVGLICASAGGAILSNGIRLFDQIEIGERWKTSGAVAAKVAKSAPQAYGLEQHVPLTSLPANYGSGFIKHNPAASPVASLFMLARPASDVEEHRS
jgi:hypothetical protein